MQLLRTSVPAASSLAAILLSAAALGLTGCGTTHPAPGPSQGFIERTYQIPVSVPALAGRFDKSRPVAVQQVIVRQEQPATFRASVDVRRASPNAELKGFARGQEIFSIPAIRMNPGDPAIQVRVALPVEGRSQIVDVQVKLLPATTEASFDVSDVTVTIGEAPPAELKVEELPVPAATPAAEPAPTTTPAIPPAPAPAAAPQDK